MNIISPIVAGILSVIGFVCACKIFAFIFWRELFHQIEGSVKVKAETNVVRGETEDE